MTEQDWQEIEDCGHRVVGIGIAFIAGFLVAFLSVAGAC